MTNTITGFTKTRDSFLAQYPELNNGAVITKVEVCGCQGVRRTADLKHVLDGIDLSDQLSIGKSEVRWIDAKALSFKSTTNTQLATLYAKHCIRYSQMWILPVSEMDDFLEEVERIKEKFQAGIDNVLDNYEEYIEKEKQRSPKMAEMIDKLKLTKEDFTKTFSFQLAHFIPFSPISITEGEATEERYKDELIRDIAQEAEKVYSQILSREKLKSNTISRLQQIQDKILSFMFIHKEAEVLADAIKEVLASLPPGAISNPHDVSLLKQWFLFMSDESKLKRIISGKEKISEWLEKISNGFTNSANLRNKAIASSDSTDFDPLEDKSAQDEDQDDPIDATADDTTTNTVVASQPTVELECPGW
ncbi:DUF3150 domain-containing protein [Enterobacter hormaechei]|uniref:DUF3150 domain-containing protein n=1 Tax=Enterobacter hormaechei TaxID=158836 RepID=UPI0039C0C3BE